MYINNINILYYLFLGIIGLGIGQFVAWSTVRLPDYKKVFVREFFTIYLKNEKPKYIYMVAMALLYVGVLYLYGFQIKTLAYLVLIPMLISAKFNNLRSWTNLYIRRRNCKYKHRNRHVTWNGFWSWNILVYNASRRTDCR